MCDNESVWSRGGCQKGQEVSVSPWPMIAEEERSQAGFHLILTIVCPPHR